MGTAVDAAVEVSIFQGRGGPMVSCHCCAMRPAGLGNAPAEQAARFDAFLSGTALPDDERLACLPPVPIPLPCIAWCAPAMCLRMICSRCLQPQGRKTPARPWPACGAGTAWFDRAPRQPLPAGGSDRQKRSLLRAGPAQTGGRGRIRQNEKCPRSRRELPQKRDFFYDCAILEMGMIECQKKPKRMLQNRQLRRKSSRCPCPLLMKHCAMI